MSYFPDLYFPGRGETPPPASGTGFRAALVARLESSGSLASLVSTRIFAQVIPQSATLPALAYRVPEQDREHTLDGVAGVATARVELWVNSHVFTDCDQVAQVLRGIFDGFTGILAGDVVVTETTAADEEDTYYDPVDGSDEGTHRITLEYEFQYRESIVNR